MASTDSGQTKKERQSKLESQLFLKLEKDLREERFGRLKDYLEGSHGLPVRDVEKAKTPARLFKLLQRADKIRLGDYNLLKEALEHAGEKALIDIIEEHENDIANLGEIHKPVKVTKSDEGKSGVERMRFIHDQLLEELARDTTKLEVDEMESMRVTANDWLMSNGCPLHADEMTPKEMFETMEHYGIIGIGAGNYRKLKELFQQIGRPDKIRKIETAEGEMENLAAGKSANQAQKRSIQDVDAGSSAMETNESEAKVPKVDVVRHRRLEYECKMSGDGKSGLMVIFNMFTKEREGTARDANRLKLLFEREFNFEVQVYKNIPRSDVLHQMARICHDVGEEEYPRVFVVILSHGDEEGIYTCRPPGDNFDKCKDEKIKVTELLEMFTCDKLKALKDLPKVFFIQACRGHEAQRAVQSDKPGQKETVARDLPMTNLPTPVDADFLVSYSQTEGYVSYRSAEKGSWFIQTICDVFEQNYRHHHLVEMLTMVNDEVAKKRVKDDKGENAGQVSCLMSTLRRSVYLKQA